MATDMTDLRGANGHADEALRVPRASWAVRELDSSPNPPRLHNPVPPETGEPPSSQRPPAAAVGHELVLGPLVDQVAYGFARVLVTAMRELEIHIANENRKLGENVGERLDSLQASVGELTGAVSEQRSASLAIMERCAALEGAATLLRESDARRQEEIAALRSETVETTGSISARIDSSVASLQDADAHQQVEIASVRKLVETETAALRERGSRHESSLLAAQAEAKAFAAAVAERFDTLCAEIGVQQEDIAALKSTLSGFGTRLDGVLERLDKQADALHSMYLTYSQRESELEQLIEGLTRLRSVPPPTPNRL
jgi:chromosome segregation ATPase